MASGGGFGSGAAHSAAGSSGSFHQNHSSPSSSNRYNDPFYNPNIMYPGLYPPNNPQPRSSAGVAPSKCSCLGPAAVLILGTVAVLFGIYSPLQMEASLSYSRILSANPLFVREIELKQIYGARGAYVYAFHEVPALNRYQDLKYDYHRVLDPQRHQEWALWLNKGSTVTLTYKLPYEQPVIFSVLKGQDRFTRWLDDPYDSISSIFWQRIQGEGRVEVTFDEDDDYYFALGNTDYYPVQLNLRLEARLTLYDTRQTFSECSLQSQACKVELPLFQSTSALLTTPADSQNHMDVWRVKASYKTRWWTYIIGYGTLVAIVSVILLWKKKPSEPMTTSEEKAPLVPPEDGNETSELSEQPPVVVVSSRGDGAPDDRLCVVCLDAEKDSFFDPCGHCATCYGCGLRIKESANSICPICRVRIGAVRKLFR